MRTTWKNVRALILVPAVIAASVSDAGAEDSWVQPTAVFEFGFGGAASQPTASRFLVRLDYAQGLIQRRDDAPALAEAEITASGTANVRLNGIPVLSRIPAPTAQEGAQPSWWSANWKVAALAGAGVVALAAAGGGGGDEPAAAAANGEQPGSRNVCAVNGGDTQVPDVCTQTPGGG